jgi:hypothetical protein
MKTIIMKTKMINNNNNNNNNNKHAYAGTNDCFTHLDVLPMIWKGVLPSAAPPSKTLRRLAAPSSVRSIFGARGSTELVIACKRSSPFSGTLFHTQLSTCSRCLHTTFKLGQGLGFRVRV